MSTLTKAKKNTSSRVVASKSRKAASSKRTPVSSKRTPVSSKRTPVSSKRNPSVNSIENGVKILEMAIKRNISASRAAIQKGFGRNYISDIKARVEENCLNGHINKTQRSTFEALYRRYEKNNKR